MTSTRSFGIPVFLIDASPGSAHFLAAWGGRVRPSLGPLNDLKRLSRRHAPASFPTASWLAAAAAGAAAFQSATAAAGDGTRCRFRSRCAVSQGAWQPLCVFPPAGMVRG